jgi:hypothetical protein
VIFPGTSTSKRESQAATVDSATTIAAIPALVRFDILLPPMH